MSSVLVTGAGGFIGRHTLAPLARAGYEVHAVTSRPPAAWPPAAAAPDESLRELAPDAQWHYADLLAPDTAQALVEAVGPTHLLHLAWYTRPKAYWTALENLDWVGASLRLLRAFGEAGGRRAVLAGTCAEYAWTGETHCVERMPTGDCAVEDATAPPSDSSRVATCTCPSTLYGAAKHGLRVVAERWAPQAGVSLAWGRVFYAYGPFEHPDRLVSGVALALLRGQEVPCTHGGQVCDYLYTPEMGGALAALLACDVQGPVNIASGEPVRIADVVAAIGDSTGRPELVRMGALAQRAGEPQRLTADVRRLREEVGWCPSLDMRESIARTVDWLREVA